MKTPKRVKNPRKTWFEFAKADTAEFDKLLARLRASAEWQYVDREVEIRLMRAETSATN